ncbi:Teichoic acid translocation permease protein TagG [compost metagenome]
MRNRELILNLAKNDFKTKYASSYLGILWGFINPLLTIATYWFVFQIGLRNGDVGDVPFIIWFIAGIIPWFFFSDALSSATNVFTEYSYRIITSCQNNVCAFCSIIFYCFYLYRVCGLWPFPNVI